MASYTPPQQHPPTISSKPAPAGDPLPLSPPPRAGSLLYADDVAAMVGMTKDWVYAETRAGRIPHVTLGRYYRYRPESIEPWLSEMEHRCTRATRPASSRY